MNSEFETVAINSDLEMMTGLFFLSIPFVIIMGILSILLYAVQAFAMMKISEGRGYDKGWLAWIPIANNFLIPILVNKDVKGFMKGNLPIIYGALLTLSLIPGIGIIFSILLSVVSLYAVYTLLSQYTHNAIWYLVLTFVTLGFAMPFLLLRISKRKRMDAEYSY